MEKSPYKGDDWFWESAYKIKNPSIKPGLFTLIRLPGSSTTKYSGIFQIWLTISLTQNISFVKKKNKKNKKIQASFIYCRTQDIQRHRQQQ